jgi:pyruvate/2-oxoglutarate dehydrogenase complex dihydrolipoamide acyltransferase (E2) component
MATSDPTPLVVPQMGVVEQVVVLEWLVTDGGTVSVGDPVVLLETDKAETELEAPVTGRIEIHVGVSDDEIPVGAVLATIHPDAS